MATSADSSGMLNALHVVAIASFVGSLALNLVGAVYQPFDSGIGLIVQRIVSIIFVLALLAELVNYFVMRRTGKLPR